MAVEMLNIPGQITCVQITQHPTAWSFRVCTGLFPGVVRVYTGIGPCCIDRMMLAESFAHVAKIDQVTM